MGQAGQQRAEVPRCDLRPLGVREVQAAPSHVSAARLRQAGSWHPQPHHDLSFDCVTSLFARGFYKDPEAYRRVVYIDWANGSYVPFNILKSKAEPHSIAANVLDAFHRVWPALGQGAAPAFDNVVKRGIRVLLANDLPLTQLERLVIDHAWRRGLLGNVTDEGVLNYWLNFFDQMKSTDQLAEVTSTLRRLSLLMDNPLLKYTLGQPDNALDFRALMDQGRSVIINLGNVWRPGHSEADWCSDHDPDRASGSLPLRAPSPVQDTIYADGR